MEINNKFKINGLKIDTNFNLHSKYKQAVHNYGIFGDTNIYNFDYKVINDRESFSRFFKSDYDKYSTLIDKLGKIFNKFEVELKTPDGKIFCKRLDKNQIKRNSILFDEIYDILLPCVEENIYNSNIKVMDINAYQNAVCNSDKKISSWLWHFDNHPNEFIKMMVYLTDVDETSGPLEILVDKNGNGAKIKSNRITKEDYKNKNFTPNKYFEGQYDGNRISEKDIEKLLSNGYKRKKITGKKGTIIMFSENIIHKANYADEKYRNIISTVIAPSVKKQTKYMNETYKIGSSGYHKWLD